jgi:hypothetical protein
MRVTFTGFTLQSTAAQTNDESDGVGTGMRSAAVTWHSLYATI